MIRLIIILAFLFLVGCKSSTPNEASTDEVVEYLFSTEDKMNKLKEAKSPKIVINAYVTAMEYSLKKSHKAKELTLKADWYGLYSQLRYDSFEYYFESIEDYYMDKFESIVDNKLSEDANYKGERYSTTWSRQITAPLRKDKANIFNLIRFEYLWVLERKIDILKGEIEFVSELNATQSWKDKQLKDVTENLQRHEQVRDFWKKKIFALKEKELSDWDLSLPIGRKVSDTHKK